MKRAVTRILLIDEHPIILEALESLLSREADFDVVGTARESDEGYLQAVALVPDLVLMAVEIPGRGAFTIAEEITARIPHAKIVFFTSYLSDVFLDQALRLGAKGYFLKGSTTASLVAGLHKIRAGAQAFSTAVLERLEFDPVDQSYRVRATGYLSDLTSRQIEVLRHLARGESVKEVARAMVLSERAIESHKYRIMQKLGIHDRVELARYAIREGLTLP